MIESLQMVKIESDILPENIRKPITGELEAYWATGTEGICWSFYDSSKKNENNTPSYEGLYAINSGDLLTIFKPDSDKITGNKIICWHGIIQWDFKSYQQDSPGGIHQEIKDIGWFRGMQTGVDPHEWSRMFFEGWPAQIVKNTSRFSTLK